MNACGAGNGFNAISATSGGCMLHGISHWCSVLTIVLKCTVTEHGTDRQIDRQTATLLNAPYPNRIDSGTTTIINLLLVVIFFLQLQ